MKHWDVYQPQLSEGISHGFSRQGTDMALVTCLALAVQKSGCLTESSVLLLLLLLSFLPPSYNVFKNQSYIPYYRWDKWVIIYKFL